MLDFRGGDESRGGTEVGGRVERHANFIPHIFPWLSTNGPLDREPFRTKI